MTDDESTTFTALVQVRYREFGKEAPGVYKRRPQRQCQFEDCDDWEWARGYCGSHYQKLRNEGKLLTKRTNVGDFVARFHASFVVNEVSGCWEWTAWTHPKGYGMLRVRHRHVRAHRFSWELHRGLILDGLSVLHKCDNRKCCNPDHLFLGTGKDNMQDCAAKGRTAGQIGKSGRKITEAMALNIRVMFARGDHSMQGIADIYGVDRQTISGVVCGRSHLHL